MVQLEARVALLKTVWLSLLAEPGAMPCVDPGGGAPKQYGYVLQATEWGVLALDVILQKSMDHTFVASVSDCSAGLWKLIGVVELVGCHVQPAKCVPPSGSKRYYGSGAVLGNTFACEKANKQPLLEHAARVGFKGMTGPQLSLLHKHLHVPGKKDVCEYEAARRLVAHALPALAPEEVHAIVMQRGCKPPPSFETRLTTSNLDLVDGVIEADALKAVKVAVREKLVEAEAAKLGNGSAKKDTAVSSVASTGSGASIAAAAAASRAFGPRKLVFPLGEVYTAGEMNEFKPKVVGCSWRKDTIFVIVGVERHHPLEGHRVVVPQVGVGRARLLRGREMPMGAHIIEMRPTGAVAVKQGLSRKRRRGACGHSRVAALT
jgi:hypothetical protein